MGGAYAGQGNPCALTMDVDNQVTATFVQITCALPRNLISAPGNFKRKF